MYRPYNGIYTASREWLNQIGQAYQQAVESVAHLYSTPTTGSQAWGSRSNSFRPQFVDLVCQLQRPTPDDASTRPNITGRYTLPAVSTSVEFAASGVDVAACVCVLTDAHLCLLDMRPQHTHAPQQHNSSPSGPLERFRTRACLPIGHITHMTMSPYADDIIVLSVRAATAPTDTAEDRSHWTPDAEAPACAITGQSFGLFTRRHHWYGDDQYPYLTTANGIVSLWARGPIVLQPQVWPCGGGRRQPTA